MFPQSTVLVVGAGASAEFRMPTGAELKKRIAKTLNFDRTDQGHLIGDRRLYHMLNERFGQSDVVKYLDSGRELSQLVEQFDSIDEALHWFSDRPGLVELGKVTIIYLILKSERESPLFVANSPNIAPKGDYGENWCSELLSMVVGSFSREKVAEAFSRVTIINFNYDRTIEHFLYSELQNKLRVDESQARDAVTKLKVLRPYGSVGPLPWQVQPDETITFGADLSEDHDKLFTVSKNIRTYTEQAAGHIRPDIREAVDRASRIIILGFGFHQQNMSILTGGSSHANRRIIATMIGIDRENYEHMSMNIAHVFRAANMPHLLDRTCFTLMRSMKPSILASI
jgi:hypothetical protein